MNTFWLTARVVAIVIALAVIWSTRRELRTVNDLATKLGDKCGRLAVNLLAADMKVRELIAERDRLRELYADLVRDLIAADDAARAANYRLEHAFLMPTLAPDQGDSEEIEAVIYEAMQVSA